MALFDENGNKKFYDINDLLKIFDSVWYIEYTAGFLNSFKWEKDPSEANSQLAQEHAELAIEYIKKCREIAPEELKERMGLERLEAICKRVLNIN